MLSGLWSAGATAILGAIAYWQNKKYKQLADQQNDLAFMPELYISNAFAGIGTLSSLSKVRGDIDGISVRICNPVRIWFLRGPIVNLKVAEIRHGEKRWICSVTEGKTFRDEAVPFNLIVDIPEIIDDKGASFVAVLEYENVYGVKYQKEICFTVAEHSKDPVIAELRKARRI